MTLRIGPSPTRIVARDTRLVASRFQVEHVTAVRPDGTAIAREFVTHRGSVVIVPMLDDDTVVMIRNDRAFVGRVLLELPAGTCEENEPVEHTAARELIEETGYRAESITPLGGFFASPGVTNEWMHVFIARGLTAVGAELQPDESIETEPVHLASLRVRVRSGEIEDGKTLAALLKLLFERDALRG